MKIVHIQKGNGKFRTIYVPSNKQKRRLRRIQKACEDMLERSIPKADLFDFIQGFRKKRSPVTNALAHVGFKFTVTFDIKDFFDSVTEDMLKRVGLPKHLIDNALVNGAPRQGLPSSPVVANIAAAYIDRKIGKKYDYEIRNRHIVYTRYADDMTFSCNFPAHVKRLLKEIPEIVKDSGFELAPEKTHVYDSRSGFRPITGVAVGKHGIQATRKTRRKLRAAKHQGNIYSILGLTEWCKLKTPDKTQKGAINLFDMISGTDIE